MTPAVPALNSGVATGNVSLHPEKCGLVIQVMEEKGWPMCKMVIHVPNSLNFARTPILPVETIMLVILSPSR